MSARLSTAIRIGDVAKAILRKTRTFPNGELGEHAAGSDLKDIGVEPMLLALSMELALKAWFVFDFDDPEHSWSHDLAALFDKLKPESQEKLDAEFKRSVAPYHPNFHFPDYGIRHVLYQHKNAFLDWRYIHEPKSTAFERSVFEATLEMVLLEFDKRYRIERRGRFGHPSWARSLSTSRRSLSTRVQGPEGCQSPTGSGPLPNKSRHS